LAQYRDPVVRHREGYSGFVALRAFRAETGGAAILRSIRQSKGSSLFTVLVEDVAALAGLCIAMSGVVFARVCEMPALDGLSSVGIGVLLVAVAVLLLIETHGLLIGEAADPALVAAVRATVAENTGVQTVHEVLTQHMGPRDVLLAVSADMDDEMTAGQIEAWMLVMEHRIRADFPHVTRVFIEIQARSVPTDPALDGHLAPSVRQRPSSPARRDVDVGQNSKTPDFAVVLCPRFRCANGGANNGGR
jgi:divalent metal cation (Fe/Co/Zn/Cd) transporter